MKRVTSVFLFALTLFFTTSVALAQTKPDAGTIGLSASLQQGQTNIKMPIWASQNVVIAPVLGVNYQENNYTSINLGISPRFYQNWDEQFATYIGAQGLLQRTSPEVGPEDTDFLLGGNVGGEYFLDSHFSVGVEGQLNYLFNDNGNNTLSTGAAIVGSVYF